MLVLIVVCCLLLYSSLIRLCFQIRIPFSRQWTSLATCLTAFGRLVVVERTLGGLLSAEQFEMVRSREPGHFPEPLVGLQVVVGWLYQRVARLACRLRRSLVGNLVVVLLADEVGWFWLEDEGQALVHLDGSLADLHHPELVRSLLAKV